jgi:tetratricopeptide (TPR) repeat protein
LSDLLARLQAAVGSTYRIERELGGGGMSRVFLADEVALGRQVVVKVLPPDMAAGVNVERFRREIQLAAKLQHPHIVPVLSAGAEGDLLYYVMPYIEGESLRVKLAREGELPVGEVVRVLREVVDALAYAHGRGVVHRDIKPDNVLLSGHHAVVTDFGVAKAVSEATGESSLTSLGVALGTPAYMAPEQAVADPHVDHRADLYAVGAVAYEMLTGRPPFSGRNAQAVLAAHVTESPEPVTAQRHTVPPALAELVMRCLAKRAADRWQRAEELMPHLEALLTPSGGTAPTGAQPVPPSGVQAALRRGHPLRVAALFGAASVFVLAFVYLLMLQLGLPDWVFAGAVVLLALGLPIMLLTGHHERRRAIARTTGLASATPAGLQRHFTWRKALLGGGLAFAALGFVTALYTAMRLLGIGPVGTLLASGAIADRERLLLAEVENRTADSTLGPTVTELLRVGLSQSPVVRILDRSQVDDILGRMERAPGTTVGRQLSLEIAEREGLKAVIVGDLVPVGDGYVVSARLLSASGDVLTAQQASAGAPGGLIEAVDQLATKLRERFGESLRSIRGNAPLERVTTGSLDALRLYAQAQVAENAGDDQRATQLLEEALAVDSTFAMAYRKLGVILRNNFEQPARVAAVLTKAYEYRERLTERERAYTIAQYHVDVTEDREAAISAYRTLLEKYPDDQRALNNTGVLYSQLRDDARALEFYRRAMEQDSTWVGGYGNVAGTQLNLRDVEGARRTIETFARKFPGNPRVEEQWAGFEYTVGDHAAAAARLTALRESQRASAFWRATASGQLARIATLQGKLGEAERHWQEALAATEQRGLAAEYLELAIERATGRAVLLGDPPAAQGVEQALRRYPLESLPVLDRPYVSLVALHGIAGDAARARALLRDMEASGQPALGGGQARAHHRALAEVALAGGDPATALAEFIEVDRTAGCLPCSLTNLARAYDAAGRADSALALWERYASGPVRFPFMDAAFLPTAYRRAGELAERAGDRDKAAEYYGRLLDLWKEADPALQPVVREVRQRLAGLVGER